MRLDLKLSRYYNGVRDQMSDTPQFEIEPRKPANEAPQCETGSLDREGRRHSRKWIIVSIVLASLWLILTLLAESSTMRENLVKTAKSWSEAINGAQVHEHFFGYLATPDRSLETRTPGTGGGSFFIKVVQALGYTVEKAFSQGILSIVVLLLGLGAAVALILSDQNPFQDNRLMGWVIGVPLLSAVFMFLLKVVVVWLLGALGAILQIVGTLAVGILAIDKLKSLFDLARSGRDIAAKAVKLVDPNLPR